MVSSVGGNGVVEDGGEAVDVPLQERAVPQHGTDDW